MALLKLVLVRTLLVIAGGLAWFLSWATAIRLGEGISGTTHFGLIFAIGLLSGAFLRKQTSLPVVLGMTVATATVIPMLLSIAAAFSGARQSPVIGAVLLVLVTHGAVAFVGRWVGTVTRKLRELSD